MRAAKLAKPKIREIKKIDNVAILEVNIIFFYPYKISILKRQFQSPNISFKNWPVYERGFFATSSGVPVAIISPPLSPPSGPKSIM